MQKKTTSNSAAAQGSVSAKICLLRLGLNKSNGISAIKEMCHQQRSSAAFAAYIAI